MAKPVLSVPVAAVALFAAVAVHGTIARVDGGLLLAGYAASVLYLVWLSRRGVDIESAAKPRKAGTGSRALPGRHRRRK